MRDFKIERARSELPLNYIHFEITHFLKICIGPQGWFVKRGTGNSFTCTCQQNRMTDVPLQKLIGAQRKQESTSFM